MRRLVWMVLFAWAATACSGGSQSTPVGDQVPRQGSIRVVNALPDSSAIVGVLSGSSVGNVNYAESTVLAKYLVGRYVMSIVALTPGGTSTILVPNDQLGLTQQDEVSYLMLGTLANSQLLKLDNVEIDFGVDLNNPATWPPPDYQIVHAATGTGPVDVYVTEQSVDINTVAPTATVSFGDYTPLTQLDPSVTYRVRVTDVGSKVVLFDSGPYTQANLVRSIYMVLDNFGPGGEPLRVGNLNAAGLLNFPAQTLEATWRFANYVPDTGPVDVYVGAIAGVPAFAGVGYGEVTAYLPIDPTQTTVFVTPANDQMTTLYQVDVTPVSGQARTLYLSGLTGDDSVASAFLVDSLRSISAGGQFRFVDASPAAGSVDIYLTAAGQPITDATPILSGAQLLGNTSVVFGPGDYDLTVTRGGTATQLAGPMRISFDAGNVYDAVLYDSAGGGAPLQFDNTPQQIPPP